jgi:ATP-dependent helicase/nuclease subunit B
LAQVLVALSDELTAALLPAMWQAQDETALRWQKALQQLSPTARHLISDEAQLVWSIWKTQLDNRDPSAARFARMMRLATQASEPLVWIAPAAPDPFEQAFLRAYGERQAVTPIFLDWHKAAVAPALTAAWPELQQQDDSEAADGADVDSDDVDSSAIGAPPRVALCPAVSMEQEAQFGAQTVVDWLRSGKTNIAVVAQDRVVARRLRALLERAQVYVADETGWKLSTTRAASAIAAWFDVVAARGETAALLDVLKSPFVFAERADKDTQLMTIELCLRNANVLGGWEALDRALAPVPQARELVASLARQASVYGGRRTIAQWCALTDAGLVALGIRQAWAADAAGIQVSGLLQQIADDCAEQSQPFSFAEWRAFVALQLESTSFLAPQLDRRVVMLPLGGTQLRFFDALLMLGCDAEHLPSPVSEALFFANAVRRELGLSTQESRQRQQLREFAALMSGNGETVLSWQTIRDGEPNPVSPWIARLQLTLERANAPDLPTVRPLLELQRLQVVSAQMPAPAAPHLLPQKLSASGYNSLVACPYQFFATRMLGLSGLEELSEMPEKRDYGDWLHRILNEFHQALIERAVPPARREALLRDISAAVFEREIANNAAALGYYARWQKALPAYLDWANRHEADGWHFVFGERKFEKQLQWQERQSAGKITLHGRIDRIDESVDGERAVLDYKTRNAAALRDKLKQGEDRQLAFYGILSDLPVTQAHYVALEPTGDKIDDVEAPEYPEWRRLLELQITDNLRAVGQGAALPATGVEAVCEYCAVRGLCRKGAW